MDLKYGQLITRVEELPPVNTRHHAVIAFELRDWFAEQTLWMSASNGSWQFCDPEDYNSGDLRRNDEELLPAGQEPSKAKRPFHIALVDVSLLAGDVISTTEDAAELPEGSLAVFNHPEFGYRVMLKIGYDEWWDSEDFVERQGFFSATNDILVNRLNGRVVWVPPVVNT